MNYTYLMDINKEDLEQTLPTNTSGPAFVDVTDPIEKEQGEKRTKKLRHLTEYPLNIDTIII